MKSGLKIFLGIFTVTCLGLILPLKSVQAQNYGNIQSPSQSSEKMIQETKTNQTSASTESSPFENVKSVEDYKKVLNKMPNAGSVPVAGDASSTYTLGINDIIEVTVMRHPEVTGQYIINNEGKIQYEFVGDIEIAGLTKEEAKEVIANQLSTYIVNPDVTIKIVGYNSKIVYVYGEVAQPGKIFMRGDTITVREALLSAGLPLLSASTGKCKLITPSASGKILEKNVNVDALLYKGDLRENLVMKPGDTLYIPATFLAKTMRIIQPVAAPIGTAAGTGSTVRGVGF